MKFSTSIVFLTALSFALPQGSIKPASSDIDGPSRKVRKIRPSPDGPIQVDYSGSAQSDDNFKPAQSDENLKPEHDVGDRPVDDHQSHRPLTLQNGTLKPAPVDSNHKPPSKDVGRRPGTDHGHESIGHKEPGDKSVAQHI